MQFDTETTSSAVIWLVMMVLAGLAFYRPGHAGATSVPAQPG